MGDQGVVHDSPVHEHTTVDDARLEALPVWQSSPAWLLVRSPVGGAHPRRSAGPQVRGRDMERVATSSSLRTEGECAAGVCGGWR